MEKAVKSPDVREKLQKAGVDVIGAGPDRTAGFMKEEFAKYAKLLKASGVRVD